MTGIIDYGVGNLFSLKSSLDRIGCSTKIVSDKSEFVGCDRMILPGVGAFGDASDKLRKTGLDKAIKEAANSGIPILGICLGMQMLLYRSYEFGVHAGLGLIEGEIRPLSSFIPAELKIPHIGWNSLQFTENKHPLFKYTEQGEFVYFVHSYYAADCPNVIATTEYGVPVTAAIGQKNILGVQFHPEKSGDTGLMILKAFGEI